jgi:uncharacterized protein
MRIQVLRAAIGFLLAYVTLWFAVGIVVAEGVLHPARRALSAETGSEARRLAQARDARLTDVSIPTRDGATLSGGSIRPRHGNGNVVILLHGLGDNRAGMIGYMEMLLRHGFSVLMPDARAHGASGGQLATYGLLESRDIHEWFRWLQANQHPGCIFGFGESLGAAELLESLAAEPDFCAVAAESSFSSFREIGFDRVGQFFGTGPWLGSTVLRPILEVAFVYADWRYKMNFDQLSPERIVATPPVPVFLIHGQNDRNIPIRHSRRIASENSTLTLWEVPDTDPCGAMTTSPDDFERRVTAWFDTHSHPRFQQDPSDRM